MTRVQDMRRDYRAGELNESELPEDPLQLFDAWFVQAREVELEANAMTLATVGHDGAPRARTVLLKGIEDGQLVFYTNYQSHKGQELERDARCALVFLWLRSERQVRVSGRAAPVETQVSDAYFASRPRESQLGAWASSQSQVVADRAELEARFAENAERFADKPVPRPPHWGGYAVALDEMEFWQGRSGRMHDRVVYSRTDAGVWTLRRLMP